MATYYVDLNDEPRKCTLCEGARYVERFGAHVIPSHDGGEWCGRCNGTGRLGNPEAAQIVVERSGMAGKYGVARERWRYRLNGSGPWRGSYRLESEAIAAARAALKGGN